MSAGRPPAPARTRGGGVGEWVEWHRGYSTDPGRRRRLEAVREAIARFLSSAPPGRLRVVSLCAGDGRDLLGVLAGHPRARDVSARLIELDRVLVRTGRAEARRLGLSGVRFRRADAGLVASLRGAVPADLVLVCGVFGNLNDTDIHGTVGRLPELCAPGATVVWTRGRFEPDLTPSIRAWFREGGFEELRFQEIRGTTNSVGTARLLGRSRRLRGPARLFTFLPRDERPSTRARERARAAAARYPSGDSGGRAIPPNPGL